MHLTLLVPGLLWPREILRDTAFDLPLPALATMLGRGRLAPARGIDDWLAASFDLAAPLPIAPLRLLGDGGQPGEDHWLCLDPVHLRVGERQLVVHSAPPLAAEEDAALRHAVSELIDGDLVAVQPGRWHLRLAEPPALDCRPLPRALGQPLPLGFPAGSDGTRWRRLLAEAQPLLHAHDINRRREAAGQPTVDSLWPWGDGRLPRAAKAAFDVIWSDDPVLGGLGHLSGIAVEPPPARHRAIAGDTLAHLGDLLAPTATLDALAWRAALARLDAEWLAPAVDALRQRRLTRVTLVADGEAGGFELTLTRGDLRRFWRKPRPLWQALP